MMEFEINSLAAMKQSIARLSAMLGAEGASEDLLFHSRLAVSELIVNALRYGGGKAYVRAERGEKELRISVRGEVKFRPPDRTECPPEESERGRGLYLVDALCDRREYSEKDGVRIVFFLK